MATAGEGEEDSKHGPAPNRPTVYYKSVITKAHISGIQRTINPALTVGPTATHIIQW